MAKKATITIIGAGIAGCFTAILLAKRGYQVEIYERSSQKEMEQNSSKKSFNLTFYGYGLRVLQETGLWKKIQPISFPLKGSSTQTGQHTAPIIGTFDTHHLPYYTIQRNQLIQTLIKEAMEYPSVTFHFQTTIIEIDTEHKTITIQQNKDKKTVPYELLIGADGVHSVVRNTLQQTTHGTLLKEQADWNYKQISLSHETVKKLQLQANVAYGWIRQQAILLSFPKGDGSHNAMLILPDNTTYGFPSLSTKEDIENYMTTYYPHLLPAITEVSNALLTNPEGHFYLIHTAPWYYKDSIVLIGDAAHGFPPFFGQGMSAAFGDAIALTRLLDRYPNDWKTALAAYQEARKKHMDALGDLSVQGFARYHRTKKADYASIYERLESILHRIFPKYIQEELFIPIANDPNHTADYQEKRKQQRRILSWLGLPLAAWGITGIVALQEYIEKRQKK